MGSVCRRRSGRGWQVLVSRACRRPTGRAARVPLVMSRRSLSVEEHLWQISEAVDALWADVEVAREGISGDSSEFERRTLVRTVFAFVEGYTHWLKNVVAESLVQHMSVEGPYDLTLLEPLLDDRLELARHGGHWRRRRHVSTQALLGYLLRRLAAMGEVELPLEGRNGWRKLDEAWKLRDRLTHPKSVDDVQVSLGDAVGAVDAVVWLLGVVTELTHARRVREGSRREQDEL